MALSLKLNLAALYLATLYDSVAAGGHLVSQAKWRPCDGFATNIKYITGTNVTYSPSWAGTVSRDAHLDKGKTNTSDLVAACDALVEEGQVGEIYVMDPENADGCTDCLRMAIYDATEEGKVVGYVSDTGDQAKYVCGYGVPPPARPECPTPAPPTPAPAPESNSTSNTNSTPTPPPAPAPSTDVSRCDKVGIRWIVPLVSIVGVAKL